MRVISGVTLFIALCIHNGLSLQRSTSTSKPTDGGTTNTPKGAKGDVPNYGHSPDETLRPFDKKQLNTNPDSPLYYLKYPFFITVPTIVSVADDIPVSTEISRVKAVDPDIKRQRKIVYRVFTKSFNQIFGVDRVTGAIITKARLDTGAIPKWNVTEYVITIVAEFQNETKEGLFGVTIHDEAPWAFVVVSIRALNGGSRDLMKQPSLISSTEPEPEESFWDVDFWLKIELLIASVILGIFFGEVLPVAISAWKHRRIGKPPPPKCVHVVAEPSKI